MLDDGVISEGELRYWARPPPRDQQPYYAALSYFIGALFFQFAVVVPVVMHPSPLGTALLEWLPEALGGGFFSIASAIEFYHNWHHGSFSSEHAPGPRWRWWSGLVKWDSDVWWLCFTYLVGSVLYFFAATCGLYKTLRSVAGGDATHDEIFSLWLIDFPYTVGSILYWVGGWVQMQMWKQGKYGLGMLSSLNDSAFAGRRGWCWHDRLQLQLATWYATLVVLNIGLMKAWDHSKLGNETIKVYGIGLQIITDVFSEGASLIASHAILLLGTIVHMTPQVHPFVLLVRLLRLTCLLFVIAEVLKSAELLSGD